MTPRRVSVEVDGHGIARIRLVRTDAHNAIDLEMVEELAPAVAACEVRRGVRCVLVSAEGPSFTVGGDLRYLVDRLGRLPEELGGLIDLYHETLVRLADLPAPVVCAVRGGTAGGGLGLLWCADVVIAADDLKLTSGFAHLGLSGDGGSTWFLPRLVGMRRALDLTLGGLVLDAAEALDWGLVSRVVPADRLDAAAEETARRFAAGPTVAYGHMRRLLRRSSTLTLAEGLAAERSAIVDCGATADGREGVAAFAERRRPHFEGR